MRNINTRRGIRLFGNVGSGKTMIMRIMTEMFAAFKFHYATQVAENYEDGDPILKKLGRNSVFKVSDGKYILHHACIDDIGKEENASRNFRKAKNVIGEILDSRYINWINYGLKTHITDNLTPEEIISRYGDRVESRICQMTNMIILGGSKGSTDWRKI